jgi:hypothetical protein
MRRKRFLALAALALPMLAGCVDDRPYPVADTGTAFYSDLPPLPPPNYNASTTPGPSGPRRAARRASPRPARATGLSDDQIRIRILQGFVANCQPGQPCVCPDVTPEMIAEWRRQHGAA